MIHGSFTTTAYKSSIHSDEKLICCFSLTFTILTAIFHNYFHFINLTAVSSMLTGNNTVCLIRGKLSDVLFGALENKNCKYTSNYDVLLAIFFGLKGDKRIFKQNLHVLPYKIWWNCTIPFLLVVSISNQPKNSKANAQTVIRKE